MTAYNKTRQRPVASRIEPAVTPTARMRGLLGRTRLEPECGLWIAPCAMVHTFFMRFPIDVVFLDRAMKVRRVIENLKPWRVSPWVLGAHSVLELAAGSAGGLVQPGDELELKES